MTESTAAPRIIADLEYSRVGNRPLLLDLYLPETRDATKPIPLLVFIHGGGWHAGSRVNPPRIPLSFGYAIASIDYRLSQEAIWPAQIEDCKSAVSFMRRNSGRFGIDPDKIVAWGISAGGHLAAMMALLTGESRDEQDKSWHVQAGSSYCGPTDVTLYTGDAFRTRFGPLFDVTRELLGGSVEEKMDLARDTSPIYHVTPHCAPLMIVHGDQDAVVPVEDAPLLYNAIKKAGAAVEMEIVLGGVHYLFSPELDARSMRFFDRVLGRTASP